MQLKSILRWCAALLLLKAGDKNDADEVFQEVFYGYVRKNLNSKIKNIKKAWLLRVTVNCSKKLLKSSWKTKSFHLKIQIILLRKTIEIQFRVIIFSLISHYLSRKTEKSEYGDSDIRDTY